MHGLPAEHGLCSDTVLHRRIIRQQIGRNLSRVQQAVQEGPLSSIPREEGCDDKVVDTLRLGRRFQDSVRPNVFLYHRDYADLPFGNTAMVVVVWVGVRPDGTPNTTRGAK